MKNIIIGNWNSKDQLSRVDTTKENIGKWEVLWRQRCGKSIRGVTKHVGTSEKFTLLLNWYTRNSKYREVKGGSNNRNLG